jgi:SAM-dependent methyltransferase
MACRSVNTTLWIPVIAALSLAGAFVAATPAIAETPPQSPPALDVPFEATPQLVVEAMLGLAKVGPNDFVVDLGCGDGRIPIVAAKTYGARGLGVDLDPERIAEARVNAARNGVAGKVSFIEGDLFKVDLRKATVVTLFLWPDINIKLRPHLLDLVPGTRIVSHQHEMGDWRPDATNVVKAHENMWGRAIHLWIVPAKIGGNWSLAVDRHTMHLKIEQKYQTFSGSALLHGRIQPIRNGQIRGTEVSFDLAVPGGKSRHYVGRVSPAGEIDGEGWHARRKVTAAASGSK